MEKLQGKQQAVFIGILGVHSGAGATTMTITFANYLAGFLGKKVAVYEYGTKNDFAKIYDSIYGEELGTIGSCFVYESVTYYMKNGVALENLLNESYDIILVDFGSAVILPGEFLRCQHKIVISSMEPWYCGKYEEFCRHLVDYSGSDAWLHIIGSDSREVKRLKRVYRLMAVERPNISNAYVIDKDLINFFQSLF